VSGASASAGESRTLLVELVTEELPPKALRTLGEEFGRLVTSGLAKAGFPLVPPTSTDATPRRLAVSLPDVPSKAADREIAVKLMPAKVAFDAEGRPTTALAKRLEKEGSALADVERRVEGGEEQVYVTRRIPGRALANALDAALGDAIARLPIPKVMTYQRPDGSDQKFVRPAHRLVALHGEDVVPVSVLGLAAGRLTEGHRFQGQRVIALHNADEYEATLRHAGKVIANLDARKRAIDEALTAKAEELGADLARDAAFDALLEEVTALTENPAVYVGRFDEAFLDVPQECLILTMRTNQKYFPLFDRRGRLRREFLIVSNMTLDDPSRVIEGNERVIRPRLADAKFFYNQDRRTKLVDRIGRLASVVYHNKLGSQIQRIERMQILAAQIAKLIGADPALAQHAAALAKADLVTDMVGEFPELQGVMGRYYALADGEPPEVADAIEQHYRPRFAGDKLPENPIAISVALADKIDTLVGIYGIGLVPTGDKDAYGLRRHALGVLRILIEHSLPLELPRLLEMAASHFFHDLLSKTVVDDLFGFMLERLRGLLREEGYTANEIEAVLSQRPARIDQVPARLAAVRAFGKLPEAEALASANKRIQNILKKADARAARVDASLMSEDAERALWQALVAAEPGVEADLAHGRYTEALKALAALRGQVDTFFDKVLVNAEDAVARLNRLALLDRLGRLMNRVADIAKLAA
jgi:glycyl-tRNA synthetase beta chain